MVDRMITNRDIRQRRVERAFRVVERPSFLPRENRRFTYLPERVEHQEGGAFHPGPLHLSALDIYAQVLEYLQIRRGDTFLNVGTGSGYFSTLVGVCLGDTGTNHGIEIFKNLITYSKGTIKDWTRTASASSVGFAYPDIRCADIHDHNFLDAHRHRYDRIYISFLLHDRTVLDKTIKMLKIGGILVVPMLGNMSRYTRLSETEANCEVLARVTFAAGTKFPVNDRPETPIFEPIPSLEYLARQQLRRKCRQEAYGPLQIKAINKSLRVPVGGLPPEATVRNHDPTTGPRPMPDGLRQTIHTLAGSENLPRVNRRAELRRRAREANERIDRNFDFREFLRDRQFARHGTMANRRNRRTEEDDPMNDLNAGGEHILLSTRNGDVYRPRDELARVLMENTYGGGGLLREMEDAIAIRPEPTYRPLALPNPLPIYPPALRDDVPSTSTEPSSTEAPRAWAPDVPSTSAGPSYTLPAPRPPRSRNWSMSSNPAYNMDHPFNQQPPIPGMDIVEALLNRPDDPLTSPSEPSSSDERTSSSLSGEDRIATPFPNQSPVRSGGVTTSDIEEYFNNGGHAPRNRQARRARERPEPVRMPRPLPDDEYLTPEEIELGFTTPHYVGRQAASTTSTTTTSTSDSSDDSEQFVRDTRPLNVRVDEMMSGVMGPNERRHLRRLERRSTREADNFRTLFNDLYDLNRRRPTTSAVPRQQPAPPQEPTLEERRARLQAGLVNLQNEQEELTRQREELRRTDDLYSAVLDAIVGDRPRPPRPPRQWRETFSRRQTIATPLAPEVRIEGDPATVERVRHENIAQRLREIERRHLNLRRPSPPPAPRAPLVVEEEEEPMEEPADRIQLTFDNSRMPMEDDDGDLTDDEEVEPRRPRADYGLRSPGGYVVHMGPPLSQEEMERRAYELDEGESMVQYMDDIAIRFMNNPPEEDAGLHESTQRHRVERDLEVRFGNNAFHRRIETLPLPPILIEYLVFPDINTRPLI